MKHVNAKAWESTKNKAIPNYIQRRGGSRREAEDCRRICDFALTCFIVGSYSMLFLFSFFSFACKYTLKKEGPCLLGENHCIWFSRLKSLVNESCQCLHPDSWAFVRFTHRLTIFDNQNDGWKAKSYLSYVENPLAFMVRLFDDHPFHFQRLPKAYNYNILAAMLNKSYLTVFIGHIQ